MSSVEVLTQLPSTFWTIWRIGAASGPQGASRTRAEETFFLKCRLGSRRAFEEGSALHLEPNLEEGFSSRVGAGAGAGEGRAGPGPFPVVLLTNPSFLCALPLHSIPRLLDLDCQQILHRRPGTCRIRGYLRGCWSCSAC